MKNMSILGNMRADIMFERVELVMNISLFARSLMLNRLFSSSYARAQVNRSE